MKHRNAALPIEDRIDSLLSEMTLEEKLAQMNQNMAGWRSYKRESNRRLSLSEEFLDKSRNGIGTLSAVQRADPWSGVTREEGLNPREAAEVSNQIQRHLVESTRLGIPAIIAVNCPHGLAGLHTTVFPAAIGLSSSWNRELLHRVGRVIGTELRAEGAHMSYSPVLDIAGDPRWSRVEETFGEDTHLAGELGEQIVRGQHNGDFKADSSAMATLKHFTTFGCSEGGQHNGPVHCGRHELHERFLPQFKKAIDAGAMSVMASYTEIDGIPVHRNRYLLTDILKEQWGFQGYLVSDGCGLDQLYNYHFTAHDPTEAAAQGVHAGVDQSLRDNVYNYLGDAVERGLVTVKQIDRAVRRILRVKFMLGLFENPYVDPENSSRVLSPEHREINLQTARESIILLKNDGVLPLNDGKIKRIAVIGPNAHNIYNQIGDYVCYQNPSEVTTLLQGIEVAARTAGIAVDHARGCGVTDPSDEGFADALAAASLADVIVACVGGSSARPFDTNYTAGGQAIVDDGRLDDIDCGEGIDRGNIDLGGAQQKLLALLSGLGKPLITVLVQGRPHTIEKIAADSNALLCAWYPGQEGGTALAEILFGIVCPSAKTTVSFPRVAEELPVYYNHKPSARKKYHQSPSKLLFPFGFGLSFTTFKYSDLTLSESQIRPDGATTLSVTVSNVGDWDAMEVVQLYVRDKVSTVTRPVKELKGFQKIGIRAGSATRVSFDLNPSTLGYHNEDLDFVVEPGEFEIMVGTSSEDLLSTVLKVGR
ncbi:beta-glucosidase [Verrucomicrobium sp. GAS474]|uniref:glycoside hydrolase family 3 N-terminal domain-containing protein n=1 Tax=Verrucomicrobium sp. GAS474 TaxID=1882831 RepID=UPI00087BD7C1|nr:glycoside hydrolase family 3 N-terminal domain-containing protein [Verrucomicrobium sp. GAS474]SDU05842.1 beta-glucosidase [Verrucomicrobium sp. GAS474]